MEDDNHRTFKRRDHYVYYVMERDYELYDVEYTQCEVCGKTKMCLIYRKGNDIHVVCEDCNWEEV